MIEFVLDVCQAKRWMRMCKEEAKDRPVKRTMGFHEIKAWGIGRVSAQ